MNIAPAQATERTSDLRQDGGVAEHDVVMRTNAGDGRKIRLLVLTSLYPNAEQPRHGVFVEERLRHLIDSGQIEATVIAPVPWFPFRYSCFGAYAAFARIPAREQRYGIVIRHPRYPVIPKIGMSIAPALMARAVLPVIGKLMSDGAHFDLIDAHYFYPDGVAAVRAGRVVNRPVVITARGNDVTLIPRYHGPRGQILRAAEAAAAVVTVSQALRDKLVALGVDPKKVEKLRNGVDLQRFAPGSGAAIRVGLDLRHPVWLTVGHLIERKGVHIAIEALAQVPDANLLVVGDGPEQGRLHALAHRLNVASRVRFVGAIPHDELCAYYNVADALVHPASREGMPNVVLESLACGTPVVAAPFDGATEVIAVPEAGQIAQARTADAMCAAWMKLRASNPEPAATRRYAERFGWGPTVQGLLALYDRVLYARQDTDVHGER